MEQLTIWTARVDYKQRTNEMVLNTTIGSGWGLGKLFAPTWKLVKASKSKKISWDQYVEGYLTLMRERYQADKERFHEVCKSGEIVLLCYCSISKKGRECHRFLLADALRSVAEKDLGMEVTMGGEVMTYTNDPNRHRERRKSVKHKPNVRR